MRLRISGSEVESSSVCSERSASVKRTVPLFKEQMAHLPSFLTVLYSRSLLQISNFNRFAVNPISSKFKSKMQPSYWALALFAALGVSSPVSPNLPLEARDSSDPSLANLDYVQYHFASTNIDVTLWTIRDVQGTGFGPYFSSKDPTVWFGSNYKSVCLLFCADPGADARIRSEKCRGTCKEVRS